MTRPAARPGVALLNVLIFAFIMVAVISAATSYLSNTARAARRTQWDQQTYQVALAGIHHGVAFLNKQSTQPVTVFDPRAVPLNPDDGPDVEPKDEVMGLVGEFAVDESRGLWGRYEVARSSNAPTRTGISVAGPTRPLGMGAGLYPGTNAGITWRATDLSPNLNLEDGSVWRLRSKAYIWPRANGAWGQVPPLKTLTLQADVGRLTLSPPSASLTSYGDLPTAVLLNGNGSASNLSITPTGGGGYRSLRARSSGLSNPDGVATPSGIVGDASLSNKTADVVYEVFGLRDLSGLQALADEVYGAHNPPPSQIQGARLLYHSGNLQLNGDDALNASGVLVVEGQLNLQSGRQTYNGLIFAAGGVVMSNSSSLRLTGALVSGGSCSLRGRSGGGNDTQVRHDTAQLAAAKAIYDHYRLKNATLKVLD